MKANKCSECGNETFQKDICVLCQSGITQMHEELMALLKKDKEEYSRTEKHKRPFLKSKYQIKRRNGKRPRKCTG